MRYVVHLNVVLHPALEVHAQNLLTNFNSIVNIISGWGLGIGEELQYDQLRRKSLLIPLIMRTIFTICVIKAMF